MFVICCPFSNRSQITGCMSYPNQITTLEGYHQAYKKSIEDPEGFWGDVASSFLWRKKWDKVLELEF
jgi:acetyl-CoA synthetase